MSIQIEVLVASKTSFLGKGDPQSSYQWRTKSFKSSDGKVELYLETHSIVEESESKSPLLSILEKFFNEELTQRAQGGNHIQYSVTKKNWYVISGVTSKGYEFYKKFYVFPAGSDDDSDWYICFDFIYPHADHAIYDPLVH